VYCVALTEINKDSLMRITEQHALLRTNRGPRPILGAWTTIEVAILRFTPSGMGEIVSPDPSAGRANVKRHWEFTDFYQMFPTILLGDSIYTDVQGYNANAKPMIPPRCVHQITRGNVVQN
jgi:hypothetical protein